MINRLLQLTGLNTSQAPMANNEEILRRNIKRREAKVGGTLFGPVPKGVRREFFCLDEYTWIWYEEWKENGHLKSRTTKYNVRSNGIIKAQDGHGYRMVTKEEGRRLLDAARNYQRRVEEEVYQPILNAL